MFMMTHYVSSGLSVPTENLRFSLPIYLCSVNILVYRLDFKSEAEVTKYLSDAEGQVLSPNGLSGPWRSGFTDWTIPFLFLAFLGWYGTSLGTPPYWEISLTLFLWCLHMAWVILKIDMYLAFELDVPNNKILLYMLDHTLVITITND